MDCLRSFIVNSNLNQSFTTGSNLSTWTVGTDRFFLGRTTTATGSFLVKGFKNINVFGFDVIGDMHSGFGSHKAIIDNWEVNLDLIGQPPLLGGEVVGAGLNINVDSAYSTSFMPSKYKRNIQFSDPIQSVTEIRFQLYRVQGHACESLSEVTVNWNLNYIFYYKFEGE